MTSRRERCAKFHKQLFGPVADYFYPKEKHLIEAFASEIEAQALERASNFILSDKTKNVGKRWLALQIKALKEPV